VFRELDRRISGDDVIALFWNDDLYLPVAAIGAAA
jgi:hypothetical protein